MGEIAGRAGVSACFASLRDETAFSELVRVSTSVLVVFYTGKATKDWNRQEQQKQWHKQN